MTPPPPLRSVVVHGHFYQPPRENPWTGLVPEQPSAAPFHDWNERIERECYGPITEARVLDGKGRELRRVNALARMSFDFGPTLLEWLEQRAPDTYGAILEADQESCERLDGHGNAMAMAFHHTILPLSDARDRHTEIRWGVADFRSRFGRDPEGMWLPETAVDMATLTALAEEGIRFTVLAPHQVVQAPDRGLPGLVVTPSGEVAVFVYDGRLSHAVAFGDLVRDGERWAKTMSRPLAGEGPSLRAICTDGETFGHHHEFAEMGLAAALEHMEQDPDVLVESFASFLARNPPQVEVELVEETSWSCAHGVERWRSACGCRADTRVESSQSWRAPLRAALEWLAEGLHQIYQSEAAELFDDPWVARDDYGAVVVAGSTEAAEAFLRERLLPSADPTARERALSLLEMERDALRLFTSCAWFFDDLARLEPRQVLTYAAHALELAGPVGEALREGFVERLARARANDPADGSAAELFEGIVRTAGARA